MHDYRVTLRSEGKHLDFHFGGGPIDDLGPSHPLFAALGYAAASWARFESHLDAILIHINAEEHSAAIYSPDHPVSFERKIKLLKRWFNQHPALADLAEPIRELTSRAKPLARERNRMFHSVLEEWSMETATAKFHGLTYVGDDTFDATIYLPPLDEIRSFATTVNVGNRWLCRISSAIFTEDALARLRKS